MQLSARLNPRPHRNCKINVLTKVVEIYKGSVCLLRTKKNGVPTPRKNPPCGVTVWRVKCELVSTKKNKSQPHEVKFFKYSLLEIARLA